MGIRPMMYINGNYANSVVAPIVSFFPNLWSARWPTAVNPQTNNPSDSYAPIYGPWDDPPYPAQPWEFWQYSSTNKIHAISGSIDVDVAQGGLEFVKDYLVPALWITNGNGQWTTLLNWNSGQTPVAPPHYAGQPTPVGTQTLPTPSLPGANDTVVLDVPGASVSVTLASGAQNIRKLYMREALNITGGSLTIGYIPSWDSTPIAAEFSGPVTLSGGASLSVHTLQVDAANTFALSGGTLTFNTIVLKPGSPTPARIAMSGDMSFNSLTNATATITNGLGSGSFGWINLGGASRAFNVTNGAGLFVYVPITNGALAKTGLGTLHLDTADTYSGGTTLSAGTLEGSVSGSIPGNVTASAGTLNLASASALASGASLTLASSPAAGAVNLNFSGTQTINALYFGTTQKAAGTWAASGATHNHAAFAGAGMLKVTTGPTSSTAVSLTSGSSPSAYGDFLGSTGSVAQWVKLFVTCSQTNALWSIADNLDGTFTLTFVGTPQAEYCIFTSPDVAVPMTSWTAVAGSTNTPTNATGLWQFTVTNTASQQFYRATALAPCP